MSSKTAKGQSVVSNDKQVEVGNRGRTGTEEDEAEYEKGESVPVTSQLFLKPIENSGNLDKEVVLRRIRHRKRVNKVRAVVGSILSLPFSTKTDTGDASVRQKKWVDDAFAAF